MADGTRMSKLDEAVQRLRETSECQQQMLAEVFCGSQQWTVNAENSFKNFRGNTKKRLREQWEGARREIQSAEFNQERSGWNFHVLMEWIRRGGSTRQSSSSPIIKHHPTNVSASSPFIWKGRPCSGQMGGKVWGC